MNDGKTMQDQLDQMRVKFTEQASDLWAQHQDRIARAIADGDKPAVSIGFSAKLDFSGPKASLETLFGFSQPVKDKRSAEFDDPAQMLLGGVTIRVLGGGDSADDVSPSAPERLEDEEPAHIVAGTPEEQPVEDAGGGRKRRSRKAVEA